MGEAPPQTMKTLEDQCKIFKQQQFIFIRALDNARENAHDKINSVKNINQVQHYLENNCYNLTDKRILTMFLDTCSDLNKFCTRLECKHPEIGKQGGPISKCKTLLTPTTDLTTVRAKYPHDVVNRLSCDEAKRYYGGIVSVIPIAMDFIKDGAAQIQKPRHKFLVKTMKCKMPGVKQNGARGSQLPTHSVGVQTLISMKTTAPNSLNRKTREVMTGLLNPPWKHAGPYNKWM